MTDHNETVKPLIYWLAASCAMIFVMVLIGAITRLTESGLSIVEWRPLSGALPPLNEQEWQRVYGLYQQSPEFAQKHHWMAIEDFKRIFFWEWLHRLWGRLIGLVYALPFVWFLIRKAVPKPYVKRLFVLFVLGGMQGVLGWWMVMSGLVDHPEVSHFRLAAHLSLALLIFAALLWTVFDLRSGYMLGTGQDRAAEDKPKMGHAYGCVALLVMTIIWGAFVAGLDAGRIYNTFPLMDGSFFPPDSDFALVHIVQGHSWVQFTHRWLAVLTGAAILVLAVREQAYPLGAMVFVQIGLGIGTLLSGVFLHIAVTHQAGAVILLGLLLYTVHKKKRGY